MERLVQNMQIAQIENTYETLRLLVFGLFAVISGSMDLKYKKIHGSIFFIFAGIGIFLWLVSYNVETTASLISIIGGILLGVFLLLMGWLSQQQIGIADGWFFLIEGIYFGFGKTLWLLGMTLFVTFFIGIILIGFRRMSREDALPMLPIAAIIWFWGLLFHA